MLNDFKFIFIPSKILETKEYIKDKHKNINERYTNLSLDDGYLFQLLNTINGLGYTELRSFSYKLKVGDLLLLANYMLKNQYNIDLGKIYIILETRFRSDFIKVFFKKFKDNYNNKEFNEHFIRFLSLTENPHEILDMNEDNLEIFKGWLKEEDLVSSIVKSCLIIKKGFNAFMSDYKFEEDTLIYKECRKYLYITCDKEYYISGSIDEILDVLKTYTLHEKIKFLNNYLSILDIDEFQEPILNYIYYSYGEPNEGLYDNIWQNINQNALEKYNIWVAQKKMKEFFGEDERYVFWYRYIKNLEAVLLHVNERQLFIDFGEFVIIEFRHIGNAAYVYTKADFEKHFRNFLNSGVVYSDRNFKYGEIALKRIVHRGNWQYNTSVLIRGGINRVEYY